jgi:hypothetical protein
MPRTRLIQIVRFVAAPAGVTALPHGLNLDGVPQVPHEVFAVGAGSFNVTVSATTVTLTNTGGKAIDVDVWVQLEHTIPYAIGADGVKSMVPRPFIVIAGGGGGGGGGAEQVFTYIATGAEGSDFFIPLPAARPDADYVPQVTCGGVVNILGIDCPDLVAGVDRTINHFHVITSGAVTAGDRFDVTVEQRT